ncbi:MAG: carbon-nitrogen hydrolase family protein [Verrucomicrobiia bacterium]
MQISGYDKGDLWREGYDAADQLISYMERAGQDGAQLVVFPEYILGRIQVPGPSTRKISAVAAAHGLYVIVGCWEVFDDATFANTALLFDRTGKIVGKYRKTHAAVDYLRRHSRLDQTAFGEEHRMVPEERPGMGHATRPGAARIRPGLWQGWNPDLL